MNERRYRAALDTIEDTIVGYGEGTIVAAMATVLERFGYEVTLRNPGPNPICAYCDFYEMEGIMTPIHECPAPAPILDDLIEADPLAPLHEFVRTDLERALMTPLGGKVIDFRGRWS